MVCAPYSASAGTLPNRLRKIFHRPQALIPIARSQWADRQPLLSRSYFFFPPRVGELWGRAGVRGGGETVCDLR
jgi:hypothetical protein